VPESIALGPNTVLAAHMVIPSVKELITFLHTIDGDLRRLLDSVGSVSYRGTVTVA